MEKKAGCLASFVSRHWQGHRVYSVCECAPLSFMCTNVLVCNCNWGKNIQIAIELIELMQVYRHLCIFWHWWLFVHHLSMLIPTKNCNIKHVMQLDLREGPCKAMVLQSASVTVSSPAPIRVLATGSVREPAQADKDTSSCLANAAELGDKQSRDSSCTTTQGST